MNLSPVFLLISACISNLFYSYGADYKTYPMQVVLGEYQRNTTLLELDAEPMSASFTLYKQYPHSAFVVMTESSEVTNLCHQSGIQNMTVLTTPVTVKTLTRLAECEHFDIVTAYDTMLRTNENYFDLFEAILKLGELTIIELPSLMKNYAIAHGGQHITSNKKSEAELFIFQHQKTSIKRKNWISPCTENLYRINSSKLQKSLYHIQKNRYTFWHPGINLETFKALNGTWPNQTLIETQLSEFDEADDLVLKGTLLIEN